MGNFDRTRWYHSIFKMEITIWLSVLLAVITLGTPASSSEPRVVCYYTNWSVYRPGTARFNPQNINPYLCTHLIYAFGGFTKDNTLKPFDKYQDIEKGGYAKFTGLKTYNKDLKTLLAIGGWNEGSSRFSPMVASRERRKEFVRNAIKFLRQNRFDGLDLDWEYPAFRDGSKPKDRENYAKMVKELREEFEKESQKTGKPRLLLTMAVPAGIEYVEKGYDLKTLNQYLDWMNLLSYDYHSAFEPAVNHHAPLYPLEEPNEYSVDNELNIDYTVQFYLENGADADKLVLGIPTYGRSYTLFNPDAVEIGSPADGPGEQGDATREKGYLAYYEICEGLMPKEKKRRQTSEENSEEDEDEEEEQEPTWTVMYPNPDAMGPFAYRGNQWVGYDDVDIVKKKAQYVAENGLGGIMFWSIDNDDFRGVCHGKPYPLIEAAKEAYFQKLASTDTSVTKKTKTATSRISSTRKKNRPKSTTSTTTTTERTTKASKRTTSTTPSWNITPEPPTTPDPGADFKCVDEGFYQHPRDCKKYFWCLDSGPSNLGIVAHQFTCPSGLYFNKAADSCDFARNVPCKKTAPTTKAPTTKSPTTRASSTTSTTTTTTTTRRPIRLSTKSSSLFRTSTTTTSKPDPEEEYEEEFSEDVTDEDAEDPRVIKELIDLIRKVGGIEQLEKQLGLGEHTVSTGGAVTTTPSSFNKKLYQKVLERTRGRNKHTSNSILEKVGQTSRRGPQNAGLEPTSDRDTLLKRDRPQYTTINRQRASSSTTEEPLDDDDSEEDEEIEEEALPVFRSKSVENRPSVGTTAKPLQYVNIRRGKPTTSEYSNTNDDSASRNALFERIEPLIAVSDTTESLGVVGFRRENLPEYVTIRRQRPTTEETTTEAYQNTEKEDESQDIVVEKEVSTQPQYSTIVRFRSTIPTEEPNTVAPLNRVRSSTELPESSSIPDPTTVLTVQISSFLNSPSSSETENPEAESPAATTETAEPTTKSSTTTTTTTTTTPARRINLIRRRGSTTTEAPSSTTTQVSLRNYNLVKRRRPLLRPNEITSDSDNSNDLSRKIRSTTPDSREVNNITETRSSKFRSRNNRFRSPQARSDDSVPAAASPILREEITSEVLNSDEESILTLNDASPQLTARQSFSSRFQGRFRRPTSTINTLSETVPDSEVSAATVEASRSNVISRGRSRFSLSSISDASVQSSTTAPLAQRRPTFARFSPRPFARASPSTASTPNEEVSVEVTTQRISSRLPSVRTRPAAVIGGRKLPFPSRQSTTQQTLVNEDDYDDDDDYPEIKIDDIMLSESAREENEHIEPDITTEPDIPKRRVVIKKLRAPGITDAKLTSTETIPIDDAGKKRFRVIRRKPSTTTITPEIVAATDITSGPGLQRIRKIIRKKVRPAEDEPNITAKSTGLLNFRASTTDLFNYGEKTRPVITTTTTEAEPEPVIEVLTEFYKEENKILPDEQLKKHLETQPNIDIKPEIQLDTQPGTQPENTETEIEFIIDSQVTEKAIETVMKIQEGTVYMETTTISSSTEIHPGTNISSYEDVEMKLESVVNYPQENINNEDNFHTEEVNSHSEDNNSYSEAKEDIKQSNDGSDTTSKSELETKDEVTTANEEKVLNVSENKQTFESNSPLTQKEASQTETTTVSTTALTSPLPRSRSPYKPRKKSFTPSTESSFPSSSKVFSRKYNPGAYTSPVTTDKPQLKPSGIVTRRPFSSRIFTRRPFTPRTTQKVIEEEYHDVEVLEEGDEPEQDNPFVLVPANQLFTRKPDSIENDEESANSDELLEEGEGEENYEEEEQLDEIPPKFASTTKRPSFKPRVINSNTFRTSTTTTELPRLIGSSQNRTTIITRFSSNKPVSDVKKRVQNVPLGYNSPVNALNTKLISSVIKNETQRNENSEINKTISSSVIIENTTIDDDYLTVTTVINDKDLTISDNISTTTTFETDTATAEMEIDSSTDDYLEFSEVTTNYPATQYIYTTSGRSDLTYNTTNTHNLATDTIPTTEGTTEHLTITTTTISAPPVSPIIKTQFDKLFSVSRIVEVNSKQDKHRLNKNNKTTLIEEGQIKVEKSPVVDKIGEVSRYSLIKIVEDEIPIYLTKFGHVYPVENPPDNIIRIDEARNARALNENFSDLPREHLVASESVNEAYRHVKEDPKDNDNKSLVQHVPNDDFLKYVNDDKKVDKNQESTLYTQWQFVPAAYENEQINAAKSYEIVTPRSMHTKQSTLPLEGLFKTDTPSMARKVSDQNNQPFVVFSDMVSKQQEPANIVKATDIKPETTHSIVTFAKGQEFKIDSSVENVTVKKPIKISVLPQLDINSILSIPSTTSDSISSVSTTIVTERTSSPIINLLSTPQPAMQATLTIFTNSTTTEASTTETVSEEPSAVKILPGEAKRAKFNLPRRPIIKSSNFTRPPIIFRSTKKINSTVTSNLNQKANKTTFSPTKSRFSVNRVQNVPIDLRKKTNPAKSITRIFTTTKTYTTESPKPTTERKVYFKPIRPNFRPSYSPRKTTPSVTTGGDT